MVWKPCYLIGVTVDTRLISVSQISSEKISDFPQGFIGEPGFRPLGAFPYALESTHCALTLGGSGGAWVAQSLEPPTSAQVVISRFVSSSPTRGGVGSLLWILCPTLSAPPLLAPSQK